MLATVILASTPVPLAFGLSIATKKPVEAARHAPEQNRPHEFSHAHRNILIRLEYNGGYSVDGPSNYTVTILADRSVTFVGIDGASRSIACCELVQKKTLSVSDYDELIKQVDATGLSRMKSIYPMPPDVSTKTITLVDEPFDFYHVVFSDFDCAGDLRKTYAGRGETASLPPEGLCKLGLKIQKLTGADKWAKQ
jgi:hypothetical protein